jgi:hypothetical protein
MRKSVMTTFCLLLMFSIALAQGDNAKKSKSVAADKKAAAPAGAPQMPPPAPELKRLDYLAGNWTSEGTMEPMMGMPGGKWSGKEHNEWLGKYFVVTNATMNMGGMGTMKEVATFGYDAKKKVYTYHAVSSMGEVEDSTGTVNGPDWTWTSDENMGGQPFKGKFTMHEDSPTQYSMKFEASMDGGKTWKQVMEGKATKAVAAGAAAK